MKKDLFTELIPTQYYQQIIENNKEKKSFFVLDKKKELSSRQKLIKICNESLNQKHSDGRIYHLDAQGNYSSHSVSPHSQSFEFNIEDKIKDLVLALKSKNYFTISSCEGHGVYFRRYVSIIFPSSQTALEFTQRLPFKLNYKVQHASAVLNNTLEVDENGKILDVKKTENIKNSNAGTLEYINCFIKRPYSDAWIVEVILSPALEFDSSYFSYIKTYIYKKFFLNRLTKKITQFILSDKFEPNLY